MGQCYEFGVTITEGCGHAMRVPAKPGACICPTCKARCEGQFEACARIVSEKGYIPVTAPQWAIDCTDAPADDDPQTRRATAAAPTPGALAGPATGEGEAFRAELEATKAELVVLVQEAISDRPAANGQADLLAAGAADALELSQSRLIESLRAEVLTAIDEVRREVADRDKELVSAYDRLSAAYTQLATADRSTDKAVVEGLARVARRVGRIERALGQVPPT